MPPVTSSLHVPSLSADAAERTAVDFAAVWRRFQGGVPAFAELPSGDTRALERFARTARTAWDHVLVLGIGGSSLGAQAVIEGVVGAFDATRRRPAVHFLDNVDPVETHALLRALPLRRTLVVVVTKSGSTLETLATFFIVREKLGKSWRKHVVVVTDPKEGFLRQLAESEQLPAFPIPPEVGGRFSVLSACGLLPAALAGVKIRELLAGAREVQAIEAFNFALVHAELFAQGRPITVFCPYAGNLRKLGEWYSQLLAESLGKSARVGFTPEVSIGATDQHSKLQLWSDGPDDKFYLFFGVETFARDIALPTPPKEFAHLQKKSLGDILSAEFAGTVTALREKQRPLAEFHIADLSPRTLGYLLHFFMLEVAFLGEILGVNPYDQPGVERGKIVTKEFLRRA